MLVCKECGAGFAFTSRDQEFYAEKGFTHEPQRCRECRQARKAQSTGTAGLPHANFDAVCAECGSATTVPFRPRGDRPVFCRACYSARVPVAVG